MMLPVVYHPEYGAPMPAGHRFPMAKFRLLFEQLQRTPLAVEVSFHTPQFPPLETLQLVHTPHYVQHYCQGTLDAKALRRIGLPWSAALARRTQIAVGGTILTAQLALQQGIACNTAGGTHHAYPDHGSGFCIFNDLAIAARAIQHQGLAQKILIVDLDVHQGDGTAWIFRHDPSVFTFSMHCDVNFPHRKQTSDWDVPLPAGLDDEGYLQILAQSLPDLLSQVQPDLVFYDAGVDTHVGDRLGKLALTDRGLYRRDKMVLSECWARGFPVACVIGGGYADNIADLVFRHSLLHRAAAETIQQGG
ncbi:MAG: histone deacetylase [Synechocystis sp.]